MKKSFSISESIKFGWHTFKSSWKFWLVVFFIVNMGMSSSLGNNDSNNSKPTTTTTNTTTTYTNTIYNNQEVNNVKQVLGVSDEKSSMPKALLFFLVPYGIVAAGGLVYFVLISMGVRLVFQMGYTHLLIDASRGDQVFYKTLLSDVSLRKGLKSALVSFLYGLMVFFGLLLFVIPGFYFATKYYLAYYFFVDKDLGIKESFKRSAAATKGNRFKLLLFGVASVFVMILGLLTFVVGIVPASIVISIASAYIYVSLSAENAQESTEPSQVPPVEPVLQQPQIS